MSTEQKVATERLIVDRGKGQGVIVAAGDPIPGAGEVYPYRENTPNTADAASNNPDAADKASSPRPAGPTVIQTAPGHETPASSDGSPELPADSANRDVWNEFARRDDVGIDPDDHAKKDDLIKAVKKKVGG